MSAVFESILDKQAAPVVVALSAEEREAVAVAAIAMRNEGSIIYADALESLLARSGSR